MLKYILKVFCSLLVVVLCSCIDEISFDPPDEFQDSVVIIGKIVLGEPSTVEVLVQSVFDFSFTGESFLTAERVAVFNEQGDQLEVPIAGPGEYRLKIDDDVSFKVELGQLYGIEVRLFNGRAFKSFLIPLVTVPKMDTIDHKLVEKEVLNFEGEYEIQPRIEYRVNTPLSAEDDAVRKNLKWDFTRAYKLTDDNDTNCYPSGAVDFKLIQIIDQQEIAVDYLADHLVLEQGISQTMVEGQYVTVIQEALDGEAFQFWKQANALSTNSGTFCEPPPGQIVGNIYSTNNDDRGAVFGYFYGTQHDTMLLYVDSTFINLNISVCPRPPRAGPPVCDECCDCALFFTKEQPSFWER